MALCFQPIRTYQPLFKAFFYAKIAVLVGSDGGIMCRPAAVSGYLAIVGRNDLFEEMIGSSLEPIKG
jgi:hypothetical protein